jgi:hypothetical protein
MCAKCTQLDGKIAHYRRLSMQITDKQTLDGIDGLIQRMTVEKAALRCEPAK